MLLGRKPSQLLMSSERHSSCFFNPARLQITKLSVSFDCRLQAERSSISTAASRSFHPPAASSHGPRLSCKLGEQQQEAATALLHHGFLLSFPTSILVQNMGCFSKTSRDSCWEVPHFSTVTISAWACSP